MPHSKLAVALAEVAYDRLGKNKGKFFSGEAAETKNKLAEDFDERMAVTRKLYEPEELARCPIVSHHGKPPCAFCLTAAMRDFILVPSE